MNSAWMFILSLVVGSALFALYLMCFQYPSQIAAACVKETIQPFQWKGTLIQVLSVFSMIVIVCNVVVMGIVVCGENKRTKKRTCSCVCADSDGNVVGDAVRTKTVGECEQYCETVEGASEVKIEVDADGRCPRK